MRLHTLVENGIHALRYRQVLPHLLPCESLLDLGCGREVRFLRRVRGHAARCVGVDVELEPAQDGAIRLQRADLTKPLPFADGEFDQAVMLAVLEHLPDPRFTLREAARVLKPGGRFIATTPSRLGIWIHEGLQRLRLVQDVEPGEHQDFLMSRDTLRGWLEEAGFRVERATLFEFGANVLAVATRLEKP